MRKMGMIVEHALQFNLGSLDIITILPELNQALARKYQEQKILTNQFISLAVLPGNITSECILVNDESR